MRILAIDTTGPACSVALRLTGQDDFVCTEQMQRGQAERLAPMTQDLLASAAIRPSDLDRIGVAAGPGSFAGSRIGVAFARGLALATGAGCVGVSNLEWWARAADPAGSRLVLSLHDARRGDIVSQLFDKGRARTPPVTMDLETSKVWIADQRLSPGTGLDLAVAGSGASLLGYESVIGTSGPGLASLLDIIEQESPPFSPPKPFYARPPDAKLPGGVTP